MENKLKQEIIKSNEFESSNLKKLADENIVYISKILSESSELKDFKYDASRLVFEYSVGTTYVLKDDFLIATLENVNNFKDSNEERVHNETLDILKSNNEYFRENPILNYLRLYADMGAERYEKIISIVENSKRERSTKELFKNMLDNLSFETLENLGVIKVENIDDALNVVIDAADEEEYYPTEFVLSVGVSNIFVEMTIDYDKEKDSNNGYNIDYVLYVKELEEETQDVIKLGWDCQDCIDSESADEFFKNVRNKNWQIYIKKMFELIKTYSRENDYNWYQVSSGVDSIVENPID